MNFPPALLLYLTPVVVVGVVLFSWPKAVKEFISMITFKTDLMFFWAVGASIIAVVNGAAVLGLWSTLTACHF